MKRHLFISAIIFQLVLAITFCDGEITTSAPKSNKQQNDRSVADTQTQCLSGEQGVLCQAQALAALVDENGKLQSSHSQSQAAGAASGSKWSDGGQEGEGESGPKEAEGAGDLE